MQHAAKRTMQLCAICIHTTHLHLRWLATRASAARMTCQCVSHALLFCCYDCLGTALNIVVLYRNPARRKKHMVHAWHKQCNTVAGTHIHTTAATIPMISKQHRKGPGVSVIAGDPYTSPNNQHKGHRLRPAYVIGRHYTCTHHAMSKPEASAPQDAKRSGNSHQQHRSPTYNLALQACRCCTHACQEAGDVVGGFAPAVLHTVHGPAHNSHL